MLRNRIWNLSQFYYIYTYCQMQFSIVTNLWYITTIKVLMFTSSEVCIVVLSFDIYYPTILVCKSPCFEPHPTANLQQVLVWYKRVSDLVAVQKSWFLYISSSLFKVFLYERPFYKMKFPKTLRTGRNYESKSLEFQKQITS